MAAALPADLLKKAVAAHQAGLLNEAIAGYRMALASNPDSAEVYNNLGLALQGQNKLDDAVASYRRAIELKPNFAEVYGNLGNVLFGRGELAEAASILLKAIVLKPNISDLHYNLGLVYKDMDKLEDAVNCFRRAIELRPDNFAVHTNLATTLKKQGKLEEAIASFRQAIALKPDFAEAHSNLETALNDLGRSEELQAYYQELLVTQPDNVKAHIGLAVANYDLGQFDAAQAALSAALKLQPENPAAWAKLVKLRKMTPADNDWLEKALRHGADPSVSGRDKCDLWFAIGKFYDDIKQYDLAFPAYERANKLQRELLGGFDRAAHTRLIDAMIAAYPLNLTHRAQQASSPSSLPVIVVGMMRSGTSLTEQIIASHPDAFGAGELNFWKDRFESSQSTLLSGTYGSPLISLLAAWYEQTLRLNSADATRIVDKKPHNYLYLGLIHEVFPQARIIHVRRNPVDTCLSIYFQHLSSNNSHSNDLDDLAFYYREYVRLMDHWHKALPSHCVMDVSYEGLVEDLPTWSRKIIEFIGLEWDERCLEFHQTDRRVRTASNWQVRQPIYQTSKERWRNYEKHLGPLLDLLELEWA